LFVYVFHSVCTNCTCSSSSLGGRALRKELTFGDPGGFLCVYVGRISNEKRLDLVLDPKSTRGGERSAYLAIIGDGPSAPAFARLHGQEHRVHCRPRFLSHAELAEVYASCDVHVSASEFETLGNTVLEAFACGIPVVVPRTQGFRDTVRHEQDGFLFNPADVADAARCDAVAVSYSVGVYN
jgi:glycosyltransferase involved in cell wall biosynthesis